MSTTMDDRRELTPLPAVLEPPAQDDAAEATRGEAALSGAPETASSEPAASEPAASEPSFSVVATRTGREGRSRLLPWRLDFGLTCAYLVVALVWELLVNVVLTGFFFLATRVSYVRSSRRLIAKAGGATNERARRANASGRGGAGRALAAVALMALGVGAFGPLGCKQINRQWGEFWWSVRVVADQKGDLRSLGQDLKSFVSDDPGDIVETFILLGP